MIDDERDDGPQEPLRPRPRWNVIVPVGALLVGIVAVLWLGFATSGEAEPPPLLGELRSPVRGTFVPPTATPPGARRTPRPQTTVAPGVAGDPGGRDGERRADVLLLFDALSRYEAGEGEFPNTGGNIQSLCVYQDLDEGCKLADLLGGEVPEDPLGDSTNNGYWYESDGAYAKLYVSLEESIPDDQRCETTYVEFEELPNLICPQIP